MTPTRWQKLRYLTRTLRFGLLFGGGLAILCFTLAAYVTAGPPLILYALGLVILGVLTGYGATVWGGSAYDCWPGITVICKPGAYVDDRQVIRSIEAWGGDTDAWSLETIVVYPGEPPADAPQYDGPASQKVGSTLRTGVEAFGDQEHMNTEYDKFLPSPDD